MDLALKSRSHSPPSRKVPDILFAAKRCVLLLIADPAVQIYSPLVMLAGSLVGSYRRYR